jgi:LacI family transcriptional regulator
VIRLKDIAQQANVSIMTVSKVMHDAADISASTKVRIRKLADEMGYVPDSAARGLRSRKSFLFGVVVPSMTNPIFARTIVAIEERANELGYEMILAHSLNDADREEKIIKRLLSRRVDGLFITPTYRMSPQAPIFSELKRQKSPTVILGHTSEFCDQFTNVYSDDESASKRMTHHLIKSGHRKIIYLTGAPFSPSAKLKLEGYKKALRESQIEIDDQLIFNGGSTIDEGRNAGAQILAEAPNYTAIQGANDLVTIGAASTLMDSGLRIPEDVSAVGFGNILTAEYFRTPLTTVKQPKRRLGEAAMKLMEKALKGETIQSIELQADIVIRESSGAPRTEN